MRTGIIRGLAVAAALLIAAAPASAQVGVAFAQAPEQSVAHCFGSNADATLACARARCAAGGAAPQDCLRVRWCYPAGWSADLFVQAAEGNHWHEFLCGWDSRETLDAAVALTCDRTRRADLLMCEAVEIFDPDGVASPVPE
jgi:hypothetical protein